MITGPFLDLTLLCLGVIGSGFVAILFIIGILSHSRIKYKRITSKNNKKQ